MNGNCGWLDASLPEGRHDNDVIVVLTGKITIHFSPAVICGYLQGRLIPSAMPWHRKLRHSESSNTGQATSLRLVSSELLQLGGVASRQLADDELIGIGCRMSHSRSTYREDGMGK